MGHVLTPTKKMNRKEWLEHRKSGLGGSDVSAVLGLNKYKTAFEVWLEKQPDYMPEEITSEAAHWGNRLESIVADEFRERTGKRVQKRNAIYRHKDHPFMLANIDRVVVGENALLECKTANQFLSGDWEQEEVPDAYLVQCQHYMAVLNKQKAYIAVLIGGQKFVWKEIKRDEELINLVIQREKEFWENHVLSRRPPALDGSSAAEKFLAKRFDTAEEGESINLGKNEQTMVEELQEIDLQIKTMEERKKEIKNHLKYEMQSAETAYVNGYEIKWKNVTSSRIDTKKLKREKPRLAEGYVTESVSRRFEIKSL
ncbi:YqaJ viral recombinase family protein [Marinococcus luteus]|nr:YqaJ viral recombinase family protein [Marinococcus luteus]